MPKFKLEQPASEVKKMEKNKVPKEAFHPSPEDLGALLEEGQRAVSDKILSLQENARRFKALREKLEQEEQQPSLFKKSVGK